MISLNLPACWCCWPSFSPATVRDRQGVPCCNACMSNQDRKPNVPTFHLKYLWAGAEDLPQVEWVGHPDMLEAAA
jgi:hypothetical protein